MFGIFRPIQMKLRMTHASSNRAPNASNRAPNASNKVVPNASNKVVPNAFIEVPNAFIEVPNVSNECDKNDVTIILQGLMINEVNLMNMISEYQHYGKIIISSYFEKYNGLKSRIMDAFPNTIVIDNDINEFMSDPDIKKYNNNHCFFQVSTVRKALKYVNTPYVIKTRVDNYFSNLDKFICEVIKNNDKITSTQIYVRGFNQIKYHPSDILFGGSFNEITSVFNNDHNFDITCPEVIIFKNHILQKLKELNISVNVFEKDIELYGNTMAKIFNIYNISNLNSYYFKNLKFNFTEKSTIDFFKHGCDN